MLETFVLMAALKISLRLLPFRAVRGFLARSAAGAVKPEGPDPMRGVLWSVNALAAVLNATCLPCALAVHTLLGRRGIVSDLQIGISRRPGSPLEAHAWVERNGAVIIGELADLGRFIRLPLPAGKAQDMTSHKV